MWSMRGARPECQQSFVACWPGRDASFHRCPPTEPQHVNFTFPGAPLPLTRTTSPTTPLQLRSFERSSPANTESKRAATCAPWPAWLPSWRRRAFTSTCCRFTSPRDRSPSARALKGKTREATSTRKSNNKNDNATYHETSALCVVFRRYRRNWHYMILLYCWDYTNFSHIITFSNNNNTFKLKLVSEERTITFRIKELFTINLGICQFFLLV